MVPSLLLEQKYDCPRSIAANPKNTSKYIIIIHMKWWYNKTFEHEKNVSGQKNIIDIKSQYLKFQILFTDAAVVLLNSLLPSEAI